MEIFSLPMCTWIHVTNWKKKRKQYFFATVQYLMRLLVSFKRYTAPGSDFPDFELPHGGKVTTLI